MLKTQNKAQGRGVNLGSLEHLLGSLANVATLSCLENFLDISAEGHAAVAHLVHGAAVLASLDLVGFKAAVWIEGLLLFVLLAIAFCGSTQGKPVRACSIERTSQAAHATSEIKKKRPWANLHSTRCSMLA